MVIDMRLSIAEEKYLNPGIDEAIRLGKRGAITVRFFFKSMGINFSQYKIIKKYFDEVYLNMRDLHQYINKRADEVLEYEVLDTLKDGILAIPENDDYWEFLDEFQEGIA